MAKNKKLLLNEEITSKMMALSGVNKDIVKKFLKEAKSKVEESEELDENEELDERSTASQLAKDKQKYGKIKEQEDLDEVETKNQARVSGDTDRLKENDEMGDMSPPEGEEVPHAEPDGDEGSEGDVMNLLSVIADALEQATGVQVDVAPGAGAPPAPGGDMPPPSAGDDEMAPMSEAEKMLEKLGYVKTNEGKYEKPLSQPEGALKEDAHQEKMQGSPKPGTHEKVAGVPSPEKPDGDKDPKTEKPKDGKQPEGALKEGEDKLEEMITKRVLGKLLESFRAIKAKKQAKK